MKIARRAALAILALFLAFFAWAIYLELSDASQKSWYWMTMFSRPSLLQKLKAEPRITHAFYVQAGHGGYPELNPFADAGQQQASDAAAFMKQAKAMCARQGIPFEAYMDIAELLRGMDLDGFSYVYSHDDDGDHICDPVRKGDPAIGIVFFPSNMLAIQHWYYALDGKEPPDTAPYGVIGMGGGWYFMTP